MTLIILLDESRRLSQTAQTGFYTPTYMREMAGRLGAPVRTLDWHALPDTPPAPDDVVWVGADTLTPAAAAALKAAADRGALVVGFATRGGEEVFGCRITGTVDQADPYDAAGYWTADPALLTVREGPNPALPVLSPLLRTEGGTCQAVLRAGNDTLPGLIAGNNTVWFPFDLPDTLLKIQQGKPVPEGPSSYFPVGRVPDARSLPVGYDPTVPVADLFLLVLEKLLWRRGLPLVHVLPPMADGQPADMLYFFGGDDDATDGELDLRASQIMAERGLPYHMNVMPRTSKGDHALSKEQYDVITARGHELALHYDMTGGINLFTREGMDNQIDTFVDAFGRLPVCNVGHCLTRTGYAEYARWQSERGVLGDNSILGYLDPVDINAFDLYTFGFGTAFPFFVYDDAAHGGRRLPFCGLPLTYYEPRRGGQYGEDNPRLRLCADNAAYYGQTVNLFSHPHYVAFHGGYDSTMTLRAFDTVLAYSREGGRQVKLTGTDELCLWWHARAACRVQPAADGSVTVVNATDDGMVVKLPAGEGSPAFTLDGRPAAVTVKTIGGLKWALVTVCGRGGHTLRRA